MAYLKEDLSFDSARVEILNEDDGKGGKSLKMKGAFLYRWTNVLTKKWYIGSRTARGCSVYDGYVCSSKTVSPMIIAHPEEWVREILAIGEPKYILELETSYLKLVDAKKDTMSFNMHNGDGKFTTLGSITSIETRKKQSAAHTGKKKPDGFAEKISLLHKNKVVSPETRKKIGIASKGRVQSESTRAKNSAANSGSNNGFYGKHHSAATLALMAEKRKLAVGVRSATWRGFWVSPSGERFTLLKDAAAKYTDISVTSIRVWSKSNRNGWSFDRVKEDNNVVS